MGLLLHMIRACLQGGWVGRLCTEDVDIPDADKWGWQGNQRNVDTTLARRR